MCPHFNWSRPCWSALAVLALLYGCLGLLGAGASDFFVRYEGDDSASGQTSDQAWKSIERVNRQRLAAGDRVFFEGGKTFTGQLRVTSEDAGTATLPVVIGSTQGNRAILDAGPGTGIVVENAGGITLRDLIVVGNGRTNNLGYGILCDQKSETSSRLQHLRIDNVEVRGFGIFGILITGTQSGFEHVRVTHCVLRDNLRGGMEIAGKLPYDSPAYAHADVQVADCQAFGNTGDPSYLKNHSGSGIVLYQVDGGVIEHCAAWENGALCRSSGGGVGLWACASRRVTIQHCESFANRTSGADGGGLDLDGGSVECTLQYNYTHDNDGPGLMVYSYPYASHADRGNVVRFNISENDSRKSRRYAGLWVCTDGPEMTGVEIYNNTILIGPWTDQAAYVRGRGVEARFHNNVFWSTGEAAPLRVDGPHEGKLRFENNLYWREGGDVQIAWGNRIYNDFPGWRGETGQEQFGGQPLGFWTDPRLSRHPTDVRPGREVGLSSLRAFRPLPNSPAIDSGLDLAGRFRLDIGGRDLFGAAFSKAGPWPLGAICAVGGGQSGVLPALD